MADKISEGPNENYENYENCINFKGSKKYLRKNCLRTKGYNWRNYTINYENTCISGMITL